MKSHKPVVIPIDANNVRPSIVPHGGLGGLLFWISVCVFLGISTFYFYGHFADRDREARALQGDSELLRRENQKLHSVVDQLQTELGQTGSLLRVQQELLAQPGTGNGSGESKKEMPRDRAFSSSETLELRTLQERLDKVFAARMNAKEAVILPQESGVVIVLDDRALFQGTGLKIGSSGEALLHEVAIGLQPMLRSIEIRITAFADPPPTTPGVHKSPMSNWEVSSLRASAVAKSLVDVEHLPPGQVVASCRGAKQPLEGDLRADRGLSAHRLEIGLFLTSDAEGVREAAGRAADSNGRQDGR